MSSFTRPYARAFLEAAPSGYDIGRFLEAGESIAQAFAANPTLRAFLLAPNVPREAKSRAIAALAGKAGLDEYGTRFLQVLLRNHRLLEAAEVFRALRALNDERQNILRVRVTVPATPERRRAPSRGGCHRRADGKDRPKRDRPRPETARRLHRAGRIAGLRRVGGRRDTAVRGAGERENGSLRWKSRRTRSRQS